MKKILLTLLLGILSAPLIASAVVYMPVQGGTGTSTKPTLGQILIGNTIGTYNFISSSSLLSNYVTYPYASSTFIPLASSSLYYLSSNPSGYISSTTNALINYPTYNYASSTYLPLASSSLYYLATNPSGYITLNSISNTATGLTYTSGTGVTSLTAGYIIPLSASTTNWNNLYDNVLSRLAIATTTSGTGWYVSTSTNLITLNIPVASASATGTLSAADWTTFNSKQPAGSYLTVESDPVFMAASTTLNYQPKGAYISSTTPFTAGYVPYATTSGALTNSSIYQLLGGKIGIGTTVPTSELTVIGTTTSNILSLPKTTSATSGVVYLENLPFIHTYNSSSTNSNNIDTIFIGWNTGNFTGTPISSIGIGTNALKDVTTGNANTVLGMNAGKAVTSGTSNVVIGSRAMPEATSTGENTIVGTNAGGSLIGVQNTMIGRSAGQDALVSNYNTYIGYAAGGYQSSSSNNVMVGYKSGNISFGVGLGNDNTWIGSDTGSGGTLGNAYGSRGIFLGRYAGYKVYTDDNLVIDNKLNTTEAKSLAEGIIIGKMASASTSQTITFNTATTTLGAGATTNKVIFGSTGNVGIGTITPANKLEVAGAILLATSTANGLGVKTGEGIGGAVTQSTSKSTGVTLNRMTGQITMNNAALAGGAEAAFTLTNSYIASTDSLIVNVGATGSLGAYLVSVGRVSAGSASITLSNASTTSLSEAVVLNFFVLKGSAN